MVVTSPFALGQGFDVGKTKLEIVLPVGVVAEVNATCVVSVGVCSRVTAERFSIVSVGLAMTTYSVVMNNILLPFINSQSPSFSLIYTYDGKNVSVL